MLCTALLALSSGAAYALNTIKDVRTGQQNDGIRIVLDGTEDFDYDAFLLDSPNRLVIDLSSQGLSDPSPKSNLKNAYSGAVKRKKIVVLDPGHGLSLIHI